MRVAFDAVVENSGGMSATVPGGFDITEDAMFQGITGLAVHILDDLKFNITAGAASLWDTAGENGQSVAVLPAPFTVDLTHEGLNGRASGPLTNGIWYLYVCRIPETGETGIVASHSDIYGGVVIPGYPSGTLHMRKLMWGAVMRGGKLLPCHCSGWPMPRTIFTDNLAVGKVTSAGQWVLVPLTGFTPDNARLAILRTVMSGYAGHAWFANSSSGSGQKLINYGSLGVSAGIEFRINSHLELYCKISGGTLDINLDGYQQTEVT